MGYSCRAGLASLIALALIILTPVTSATTPKWMVRPGTIGHALSLSDGSHVSLDAVILDKICARQTPAYFTIRECFDPKSRLIVYSSPSSLLRSGQTVDVEGTLTTLPNGFRAIVNPSVHGYIDEDGKLLYRGPLIKSPWTPTIWQWKTDLTVSVSTDSASARTPSESALPPGEPSTESLSGATYCATIAEAKALADGTAAELQCKPVVSASSGSFVIGEDYAPDTLTVYYTRSVAADDRLNKVAGTIHTEGADKVLDVDSGPGFDPQGFVGSVQAVTRGSIAWVKTLPDYMYLYDLPVPTTIDLKVVSRVFPDGYFYIQEPDRSSGIRAYDSSVALEPGDVVSILDGEINTVDGERVINSYGTQEETPIDVPSPLGLNNRALGGGDFNVLAHGPTDGVGLNNVGILARVWGKVTEVGAGYVYLDDGSGVSNGSGPLGVRVEGNSTYALDDDDYAAATGISGLSADDPNYHRVVRVSQAGDFSALAAVPPNNLAAAATGSGKITLFWQGVDYAVGYNAYRSLSSTGPWTKVNSSPITTRDPGPVPNGYIYSDTGLTNGTDYCYYAVALDSGNVESRPSNVDSAIPDAGSIPWDTGDAASIVSAMETLLNANLLSDEPGVGEMTICAPNGVIYQSYDDAPPEVLPSPGYFDSTSGMIVNSDGTEEPATMDFSSGEGLLLFPGYGATNPATGIYRKLEAREGWKGLKAWVGLPPTSLTYARLGKGYFPSSQDMAYIYSGGGGGGAEVDAGLQMAKTGNPGWKPFIFGKGGGKTGHYLGAARPEHYWVRTSAPVKMVFKAPGFGTLPDGQVVLSCYGSILRKLPNGQYKQISSCTLTYCVSAWKKNTPIRVKRVNSIAQKSAGIPSGQGWAQSGSYVYGASWGQSDMQNSVSLLTGGSSTTWTYSVTENEGSYPGSPYITKNVHNQFFWETDVMLKTRL